MNDFVRATTATALPMARAAEGEHDIRARQEERRRSRAPHGSARLGQAHSTTQVQRHVFGAELQGADVRLELFVQADDRIELALDLGGQLANEPHGDGHILVHLRSGPLFLAPSSFGALGFLKENYGQHSGRFQSTLC